jgi:signal transduction histidine kinase
VGRALPPLQHITATARRVADRSLHERIALVGPDDEIDDLADTFDAMLERLDRSFDSERRFVANASHQLGTPLAINRTLIEVALDKPDANQAVRQLGATLLDVNRRHKRLIDGLLTLATSDHDVADPTMADLAEAAPRRNSIRADGTRDGPRDPHRPATRGSDPRPVLLERLTQNLIDNAIRYNLPDANSHRRKPASPTASAASPSTTPAQPSRPTTGRS